MSVIREVNYQPGAAASQRLANDVYEAVESIRNNEEVWVFRKGRSVFDSEGWIKLLLEKTNIKHDRRHYSFDENIALADWWEISYQPEKATSYAYSNTPQPFHCDNAWFHDPAEVNFFIMEKQAITGGSQIIYPLSTLIKDLQNESPALFDQLCNRSVTISKGADENAHVTTIIQSAADQPRIFWNYYRTDKADPAVNKMCEEFFQFLKEKENSSSVERLAAATGDCFCFNDQKFLHGREAFTATQPRERVLLQSMWKFTD